MSGIDDGVREQYDKEFDAKSYVNFFYREVFTGEQIALRKIHDAFSQGKLKGPIKRGIDIGCGPTVHRLSAFSKVCDTLVYSDYSSNNRKFVQEWINGPANDPNHRKVFEFCAKLEGFDDLEEGAKIIENRIKSKVKIVQPINVLLPQPMGHLTELFDVAFTGAVFESACNSYESFVTAVKNIASMIRPEGYLIIKGYLGSDFYIVQDVKFPALALSIEMIKKGLQEGGFNVQEIEIVDGVVPEKFVDGKAYSGCTGSFFAMAQKL